MTAKEGQKGDKNRTKQRRDYGEGSISRRADGRWQGAYYHEGKRKYVYGKVNGTRNELLQKLKLAIEKAKRSDVVAPDKITVGEYMPEWLEDVKKIGYAPNSYRGRSCAIKNHIIPSLGNIAVQKLTNRHVQKWIAELAAKKLSGTTINMYYEILHTAMEDAINLNIISANPCRHIKLPKREKSERAVLTMEQAQRLLDQVEGHWLMPILTFALATAMREGEILALHWSDIDFAASQLYVRRNVTYVPGQGSVEGPPKTASSERKITLPSFALDMLRAHSTAQKAQRVAAQTWEEHELVFPNTRNGKHMYQNTVGNALKRALERAGLDSKKFSFHNLRHSAASLLLAMGVQPKVVQEILGHSSIAMTMNLYGHLFPGMQEDAMEKLDAAFSFEKSKKTVQKGEFFGV
jgi:integrase